MSVRAVKSVYHAQECSILLHSNDNQCPGSGNCVIIGKWLSAVNGKGTKVKSRFAW